jgi:putative intracellular protease/amidase
VSEEITKLQKWNVDTVVIKKFKAFDSLGDTTFTVAAGTWSLYAVSDGSVLMNGSYTANNDDTDVAGNSIKTITLTIDLTLTDAPSTGRYYLVVDTVLASQQTDRFRMPVEIVDYRLKGVA